MIALYEALGFRLVGILVGDGEKIGRCSSTAVFEKWLGRSWSAE